MNSTRQTVERTKREVFTHSETVSFADVAHQMLLFERSEPDASLVLSLIDTAWVQRLRDVRQTGNTHLVYMFAEHSRFGHSLGVAYLAIELMKTLAKSSPELVLPYREAVAAAALLHDIGHTAPGSHLAERIWTPTTGSHEERSVRALTEDPEIRHILDGRNTRLAESISKILVEDDDVPAWTKSIISGGGWNADRGNWAIVDSAMCSVTYGRYNVRALIDAFRLTSEGELVLQENRLDALTHFFVARDSMYRQVYQHRVLQAADALTENLIVRLQDVLDESLGATEADIAAIERALKAQNIFADHTMTAALSARRSSQDLNLPTVFQMTESWWSYHRNQWCESKDKILSDLARRLRDRKLLKTIRLEGDAEGGPSTRTELVNEANQVAEKLGFDPRYYVAIVEQTDMHRGRAEEAPLVLLDSGRVVAVTDVEPMIAKLLERPPEARVWLAVPKEVKAQLGRHR